MHARYTIHQVALQDCIISVYNLLLYFKLQTLSDYYQVICSIISEAPSYLCDLLHPCKVDSRLRSDSAIKLYQHIARKSVGKRASSVTAPKLWNNLPTDLSILSVVSVLSVDSVIF